MTWNLQTGLLGDWYTGTASVGNDVANRLNRVEDTALETVSILRWLPIIAIAAGVLIVLAILATVAFRPGVFKTFLSAVTPGGIA